MNVAGILLYTALNSIIINIYGRYLGRKGLEKITIINSILLLILIYLLIDISMKLKEEIETLWLIINIDIIELPIKLSMKIQDSRFIMIIIIIGYIVLNYAIGYLWIDRNMNILIYLLYIFITVMLYYVESKNILGIFSSWEGIGLISSLLVSYYSKIINSIQSAIKALFINRIGDYTLSIIQYILIGTDISIDILDKLDNTSILFSIPSIQAKSAITPLHIWLPNAMAAPTPVSSLLHAATMVTAGLYLIIKFPWIPNDLIHILLIIFIIYSIILAGSISSELNDFKKIIAFSTCSQMGIIALTLSNLYLEMGLIHLYTHALFKALLFLSAGIIIHTINDSQDFRNIGNLSYYLPITITCFIIGSLALSGLPFIASFYSKDYILDYLYIDNSIISIISWYTIVFSIIFTIYYAIKPFTYILYDIITNRIITIFGLHNIDIYMIICILLLAIFTISITFIIDNTIYTYNIFYIDFMILPIIISLIIFICVELSEYQINTTIKDSIIIMYYYDYIARYILNKGLFNSYNISFKLIDKGILENITSNSLTIDISNISNYLLFHIKSIIYLSIILSFIYGLYYFI